MIASTAYLDLFLRSVTEKSLLKTFLRFILLHRHDNDTILDTLLTRISSNSRVGLCPREFRCYFFYPIEEKLCTIFLFSCLVIFGMRVAVWSNIPLLSFLCSCAWSLLVSLRLCSPSTVKTSCSSSFSGVCHTNSTTQFLSDPEYAFSTVQSFSCCFTFRYLLPCTHVMLSQRRAIREADLYGKSADKFLSLIPECCQITSAASNEKEEEPAFWGKGKHTYYTRLNQKIKQTNQPL